MSATFSRTLTFAANDLGADAKIMLAFDRKTDGMYKDKFPVCWKVITFGSTGSYRASVTFQSRLALSRPKVDKYSDTIEGNPGKFVEINVGQNTTLTKDANGEYGFTSPEDSDSDTLTACNGTQSVEDMAIYLIENDYIRTPVLYFKEVGAGSSVEEDFQPVLRAYVARNYQEMQIIKGEVGDVLWEQNLADLDDDNTTLNVKYDLPRFTITKA